MYETNEGVVLNENEALEIIEQAKDQIKESDCDVYTVFWEIDGSMEEELPPFDGDNQ